MENDLFLLVFISVFSHIATVKLDLFVSCSCNSFEETLKSRQKLTTSRKIPRFKTGALNFSTLPENYFHAVLENSLLFTCFTILT